MIRIILAATLLLGGASLAHAAGDAAAGQAASAVCAACHGVDGNSTVPQWPKIAGQHEDYLVRQITLIRDQHRSAPEMYPLVSTLTDQGIADLAAYFASTTAGYGAADESVIDHADNIYRFGLEEAGVPACIACHGPSGDGNPSAGYPRLGGQHGLYTATMLQRYRDGLVYDDGDAASKVMSEVSKGLSDEDIAALAAYLEGLSRGAAE